MQPSSPPRSQPTFGKAQSETARSQRDIAFDKLKVDLFDRRYRIYTAARNVIEAIFNRLDEDELSNIVLQESATLNEAVFFFSKEGREEVERILYMVERYFEYRKNSYGESGDVERDARMTLRELTEIYNHLHIVFSEEIGFRQLTTPR